jgi:hypothetical protein
VGDEIVAHGFGALLREVLVVVTVTLRVGVAGHVQPEIGIPGQRRRHPIEHGARRARELGGIVTKVDALESDRRVHRASDFVDLGVGRGVQAQVAAVGDAVRVAVLLAGGCAL